MRPSARDVIIDMYCYRRLGHNEGDEPTFTQPVMYQWISKQPTVRQVYLENLVKMGGISRDEAEEIVVRCRVDAWKRSWRLLGVAPAT